MPITRRRRLARGGSGGGAGTGFLLGPTPNVFGATAGGPDGTVAAAADRATAEATRDAHQAAGPLDSRFLASNWELAGRGTGSDYLSIRTPAGSYATAPWGTSAAWVVPIGTTAVHNGITYTATRAHTATYGGGRVAIRIYTAQPIGFAQVDGQPVTVTTTAGTWLQAYDDDTALNIRLFYTDSGVEGVAHQVYQGGDWVDNRSVVGLAGKPGPAGRDGADGAPGNSFDFSGVAAGNVVTVDGAGSPTDLGVALSDLVEDSDLATVATSGDYNDLLNLPAVLTAAQINNQIYAALAAAVTGNTESGVAVTWDNRTRKLNFVASSTPTPYAAPAFSNAAVGSYATSTTSDVTVSGQQTMTWDLANHANIAGTLSIIQYTTIDGTVRTATVAQNITPAASGSSTFTTVGAVLDTVGDSVEWRIRGTDTRGTTHVGSFKMTRAATPSVRRFWWGRLGEHGDFAKLTTLSSTTLPLGGSKIVTKASDFVDTYAWPQAVVDDFPGALFPTDILGGGTPDWTDTTSTFHGGMSNRGKVTIGGVEYEIWTAAVRQKAQAFNYRVDAIK